ncbi:NAD-dependent deacylase [Micrococcus luteus]|uniref:SIR2 family NAD-dependent protein deacylase n=1 Tax=Micrococcus luteus TaxID=1270 RepID=UPI000448F672|nr:NAD-dependent deacylase [Micrococcus luteus]EZP35558.1 NAD-dependent protein deacylase [Micrococcus luteus]MCV7529957.1 NAD-dependent deacylase [Micrococcus luteus]NNM37774.1 NAD-dependent protein deacylase [Micrococcus luteus]VWX52437.1 NAD-dependent protein deacylase 1 [Micrococcus luteus]
MADPHPVLAASAPVLADPHPVLAASAPDLDPGALDAVRALVAAAERPVVLSGAGMSAESGIPTFRDAQTGLWERFSAEQLATEEAFLADPALVWSWYRWRARMVRARRPIPGHDAVAAWQRRTPDLEVVTQNVDDLHERAGARVLAHLHGSLFEHRCAECGAPADVDPGAPSDVDAAGSEADLEAMLREAPPACPACGTGRIRPGVVWFGEMLPQEPWERAYEALERCDLALVVGTSGLIQPAASLPFVALGAGVAVVEVNPVETELSGAVTHALRGSAGAVLPALVAGVWPGPSGALSTARHVTW